MIFDDRKPAIMLDNNHNKGGVDNLDKVIGTYSCRRMTGPWSSSITSLMLQCLCDMEKDQPYLDA